MLYAACPMVESNPEQLVQGRWEYLSLSDQRCARITQHGRYLL